MPSRDLDLVLFGATGFTGGLTADYLARRAPAGLRWAIAGRSRDKLEAVRARLTAIDPALGELELVVADAADRASLDAVAARTKVLATTVGPYLSYGEPLVAACAAAGTAYVDLTGEPEFVDRMYVAHHETALRTGARIVHACGFDSIPHDLGAYYTVQQLPDDAADHAARGRPRRRHGLRRHLPLGADRDVEAPKQMREASRRPSLGRAAPRGPVVPRRQHPAPPRPGAGLLAAPDADDRPARGRAQRRSGGGVRASTSATPTTSAPRR